MLVLRGLRLQRLETACRIVSLGSPPAPLQPQPSNHFLPHVENTCSGAVRRASRSNARQMIAKFLPDGRGAERGKMLRTCSTNVRRFRPAPRPAGSSSLASVFRAFVRNAHHPAREHSAAFLNMGWWASRRQNGSTAAPVSRWACGGGGGGGDGWSSGGVALEWASCGSSVAGGWPHRFAATHDRLEEFLPAGWRPPDLCDHANARHARSAHLVRVCPLRVAEDDL